MGTTSSNDNSTWIVCGLIVLGVILVAGAGSDQFQCAGSRDRDFFKPDLGGYSPPYYAITNYPNPAFTNITVPLSPTLSSTLIDEPAEAQTDCLLTPGGQCHLASGGLGTCDAFGKPFCIKKTKKKL